MLAKRKSSKSSLGCAYVLFNGAIVVGLLVINGFLVKAFLDSSIAIPEDLRITQTLQFAIPVVLIFFEFWLFDFFRQSSRR